MARLSCSSLFYSRTKFFLLEFKHKRKLDLLCNFDIPPLRYLRLSSVELLISSLLLSSNFFTQLPNESIEFKEFCLSAITNEGVKHILGESFYFLVYFYNIMQVGDRLYIFLEGLLGSANLISIIFPVTCRFILYYFCGNTNNRFD